MEEAGELAWHSCILIIDEGIKEASGVMQGKDIVVGNGGRDKGTTALAQENLIARAAHTEFTVALDAHRDDEAIVFAKVAVEGFGDFHDADIEIGGVDDLDGLIGIVDILGAVVLFDMIVEGLRCQLGMQLARLTIHARTVVVVDAIGDIGGLLDFCQKDASTDGMDATGREIEYIAGLDLMVGKDIYDSAIGYALLVFFGGYLLLEACIEVASGIGLDDIPHL